MLAPTKKPPAVQCLCEFLEVRIPYSIAIFSYLTSLAMTQEARVAALDLDEPDDNGFHDIPMHFDPDSDHSDDSGADRDNRIQSRHDRLCALPPGDEAAGESGEGGETALLQEMESVVRP